MFPPLVGAPAPAPALACLPPDHLRSLYVGQVAPRPRRGALDPGRSLWSTCIPRVCGALAAVTDPLVLVLDDLQFVTDPTSLDAVAAPSDHVPERSQMIVASREEPALGLARLRAQGRVLEAQRGRPAP